VGRSSLQLIVATENYQVEYLDKLQTQSAHPSLSTGAPENPYESNSQIPTYFLSANEAREMEPDLSPDLVGALLVTSTGIVDSQGLVDSLEREIEEEDYAGDAAVGLTSKTQGQRGEGVVVKGTRVVRIDRDEKGKGWVVQLETGWEGKEDGEKGEVESVRADVVVNAAGLAAASLMEGIVPEAEQVKMYPLKGVWGVRPIARTDDRQLHVVQGTRCVQHISTHIPLSLSRPRLTRHSPHPRLVRERQVRARCRAPGRSGSLVAGPRLLAETPRALGGAYRKHGTSSASVSARSGPIIAGARLLRHPAKHRRERLLRLHGQA